MYELLVLEPEFMVEILINDCPWHLQHTFSTGQVLFDPIVKPKLLLRALQWDCP
jgi:hypothetical protein